MALEYELIARGTQLAELRDRADELDAKLSGLPAGTRLELRLRMRRVEWAGVDWTQFVVENAAALINAADGLAAWVASLFGKRLSPWPGQTDLAFVWVDDATGDWMLAIRWVTASAFVAAIVRFLLQLTVLIAAAGVLVALVDVVAEWAIHRVRERAEQAGRELGPIVALGLTGYFLGRAWARRGRARRHAG